MTREELDLVYNKNASIYYDYKIGDLVRIENHGNSYTSYHDEFIRGNFKNTDTNTYHEKAPNIFRVFYISDIENAGDTMFGIRNIFNENYELLVNQKGIRKVDYSINDILKSFPEITEPLKAKINNYLNKKEISNGE